MPDLVPNQKELTTKKTKCSGKIKDEYYTAINLNVLQEAMKELSGSAFKLWVYLGKNQDNYTFALSRVDAMNWCGFSRNTFTNAFAELEKEGYLVQDKNKKYHYDFYESPHRIVVTTHKEDAPQTKEEFNKEWYGVKN